MLIRSIRAENFMKYERVELEGLPARGLIGIEGQNEGGKSTVGELLQFALFGKTLSSREASIQDLIRWDRDQCTVEVEFEIAAGADAGCYRVWREVDRFGTNFARLVRVADGREVASGIIQVRDAVERICRFAFDDLLDSFYLAEKDFPRSPRQMRESLDRMVGVDVLRRAEGVVRQEIEVLEDEFASRQKEIRRNDRQIEKYRPNVEKIPEVEAIAAAHLGTLEELREKERANRQELDQLDRRVRGREAMRNRLRSLAEKPASRLREALEQLLEGYPSGPHDPSLQGSRQEIERLRGRLLELGALAGNFESLCKSVERASAELSELVDGDGERSHPVRERALEARRLEVQLRRGRCVGAGFVLFIAAVVCTLFGVGEHQGWFDFAPPIEALGGLAEWVVPAAVGGLLGIFALVSWVKGAGHRGTLRSIDLELDEVARSRGEDRNRLERLAGFRREQVKVPDVEAELGECDVRDVDRDRAAYSEALERFVGEAGSLEAVCAGLAEDEGKVVQRLRSRAKSLQKELQKGKDQQEKEEQKRDRAETEAREYRKQEGRQAALVEQNEELRCRSADIREEIETRQLLLELLEETVNSVRHRAGPSLGKAMRRLVPPITGGRYTDLKITPDFQLQVFTSEKSDFLSEHELSGGTFEGLSLAFRLALSQAFIHAVVRGSQFVFLDEPFKSMDEERVHTTLDALRRLSADMPQVFIILQRIPPEVRELFDRLHKVAIGDRSLGDRREGSPFDAWRGASRPPREPRPGEASPSESVAPSVSAEGDSTWTNPAGDAASGTQAPSPGEAESTTPEPEALDRAVGGPLAGFDLFGDLSTGDVRSAERRVADGATPLEEEQPGEV